MINVLTVDKTWRWRWRICKLGRFAERVQALLDQHHGEVASSESQVEGDKVWRLALHRMDLRQYSADLEAVEPPGGDTRGAEEKTGGRQVLLSLNAPEPELQEVVDEATSRFEAMNARIGLFMWGQKVFEREDGATYDPAHWRQRLQDARAAWGLSDDSGEWDVGAGGPGFVAVVCARDHWEEMSGDDREWCVDVICSEVERDASNWNSLSRVQRGTMSADRPSAWILPALIGRTLKRSSHARVRQLLAAAVTHPTNEVRMYAACGVGDHLWSIEPELALRCANALATEATLVQEAWTAEERRPYDRRREFEGVEAKIAMLVRRRFSKSRAIPSDAIETFDPSTWIGATASWRILRILAGSPNEPATTAAFQRLATVLVQWWEEDRDRSGRRRERNYEAEHVLTQLLEDFPLRVGKSEAETVLRPILESVERHPREAARILSGLIGAEDARRSGERFWDVWRLFAETVRAAKWLSQIDEEYADGQEMIRAVFLGIPWKKDVRHWQCLDGHADEVHALFTDLPASTLVLDCYVELLYHIGEHSLPAAFIRVASRIREGGPGQMLQRGNTAFNLEVLLRRYVYGRPLELKRDAELRSAVLELLDVLVEHGSSAAFRMRDDFVTPIPSA